MSATGKVGLIVILALCGCSGAGSPDVAVVDGGRVVTDPRLDRRISDRLDVPLVFVFTGESNSGGIAINASATDAELAPHTLLQILNNTSLAFEPLDVGSNNLIGHTGLSVNATHGMEIGLAAAVEAGTFASQPSYLVKTGQGGSLIAQWDAGGEYWTTFLARIAAAKTQLPAPVQWVVWYSQGINDNEAGIVAWKAATVAHLAKIKSELPGCQIVMTKFDGLPSGFPAFSGAIQEIADADADVVAVSSSGAANDGQYHWSYAGFKDTLVPRMVAATLEGQ